MRDLAKMSNKDRRAAVRGLATVAMLKVNFDAGRDHIAMFGPFVLDAVASLGREDMSSEDVGAAIRDRHQLSIPVNTMKTLLGRLVKDEYLRREGGRYFRTEKQIAADDLPRERRGVEERQLQLASALRDSARMERLHLENDEEALALILCFLERYHVNLALDESPPVKGLETDETSAQEIATALFLQDVVAENDELAAVLTEMLEGYVLQNTLLLKDVGAATRQFKDLRVIFDSPLLFSVLGMHGPAEETATLELCALLRDTGAVLEVFEQTIAEMRSILSALEEKIGTTEGRLQLRPSPLTRHLISKHYTPSDVRQISGLLETKLRSLRLNIRELPDRVAEYTLDEAALARELADEPGHERAPRVLHDVDCIAGVLTYRKGRDAGSLDSAGAVFVSPGGLTVKNGREWYFEQGGRGYPPIIHVLALSNYAWLKRPASASKLKVHELMALCSAALRPTLGTWRRFLDHLKRLEADGELSSEEITAIVASDLTENALAERGIDEDSDAQSLSEVVDRVKAEYKANTDAARSEAAELRQGVHKRAERLAAIITWAVVLLLGASFLVGAGISLFGGSPSIPIVIVALAPLAIFGLLSLWNGFQLRDWRRRAQDRLTTRLEAWVTAPQS